MAGQYPKALGNIHTIQAPCFPNSFYPEAEILKAVIYFTNCNYEAASTTVARFQKRYGPLRNELEKIFGVVKPDEEHILWPFDGEYWRDELGFYRQVVESACGR
jgi:hypothetical protein